MDVGSTEESSKPEISVSSKASPDAQLLQSNNATYPYQVDSAQDSDRHVCKDALQDGDADAARGPEPASVAAGAAGFPASAAPRDSGMFTQQLQRLRARLQSVVQGVREVAQSLDEPHSLIANVRDQLQSRQEASARRSSISLSTALPGHGGPPSLSRNSSLSRTSVGGIGPFRGGIPEVPDSETDGPYADVLPAQFDLIAGDAPGGPGGLSVRARVAAVERRSRSGGGLLLDPVAPLAHALLSERSPSMSSASGSGLQTQPAAGQPRAPTEGTPREALPLATSAAASTTSTGMCAAVPQLHKPSSAAPSSAADSVTTGAATAAAVHPAGTSPVPPDSAAGPASQQSARSSGGGDVTAATTAGPSSASNANLSSISGPTSFDAAPSQPLPTQGLPGAEAEEAGGSGSSSGSGGGATADTALQVPPGLDAATAAYLADHPETLRELWTLRARVRAQEAELASMLKQLSTKNAQLDQAQTSVQVKEKELGAITQRLSGVLNKLQGFQASHHHQQHELQVLHALQQQLLMHQHQQQRTPSGGGASAAAAAAPGSPFSHDVGAMSTAHSSPAGPGEHAPGGAEREPHPGTPTQPQPAPSVAATRAQLLAGIPEGDSVICFQGAVSGGGGGARASPFDSAPTGCGPLTTPQGSVTAAAGEGGLGLGSRRSLSARNSAVGPHRMFSLRSTGPSLEVSLPPPPSMWGRGGPLGSEEPEDDGGEAGAEDQSEQAAGQGEGPGAEGEQLAASMSCAREALTSGANAEAAAANAPGTSGRTDRSAATSMHALTPTRSLRPTGLDGTVPGMTLVSRPLGRDSLTSFRLGLDLENARGGPSAARSSSTQRRRGNVLGRVLGAAPALAFAALLMREPSIRQGLQQLRRGAVGGVDGGVSKVASRERRASPAGRVAAARAAPALVDVSRYLPRRDEGADTEPFESESTRQCKAKWCSIIRPPSKPLYY